MSEPETIVWDGRSGRKYTYWIYRIGTDFNPAPGNYIFARGVGNSYSPIYVGESGDLSERFDNHHKMACIKRNGATHIHVHANANENARLAEEFDIVAKWDPVCNG